MQRPQLVALLPFLALACTGGQVGEETIVCQVVESTVLDPDESALGIVPADLVASLSGTYQGELAWADGTSSAASLELTHTGGAIELHEREWQSDGGGEIAADPAACGDVVVVPVQVEVQSADGRLDETWTEPLLADRPDAGWLQLSPDGYQGTLDPAAFAPPGDATSSWVDLELEAPAAQLTLSGQVTNQDGDGDDDTVSAEMFDIGTLDAERP